MSLNAAVKNSPLSRPLLVDAPRGQKRPANFLNADILRQSEADFLDTPEGSLSDTPSLSADGLEATLDASLDFLTQQVAGSSGGTSPLSESNTSLQGKCML